MPKRCIAGLLAGVALVEGARVSRKSSDKAKLLAGVPVLNYELAYEGQAKRTGREHWVVVANKGASDGRLKELCENSNFCERVGHPNKGGVPYFEVFCTESELEEVLFRAPGELAFVEPDGTFYLEPEEVGSASSSLWGLDRVGMAKPAGTGAGVHIYVLDTGVRVTHSDFGGRAEPAIDLTSGSLRECRGDLSCAGDVNGHGTHCAGTAGGQSYGVAKEAKIYAGKVLPDQGGGAWSWSYDALDWLATTASRPAISSMSLGGRGTQAAMRTAVTAAVDAGVVVVVASGNSNSDACGFSPAFVPAAISVGSTDFRDQRSSFSNFGSCVEIWAPGSDILSASPASDTATNTFSGTSMACPHVSGGAALALGLDKTLTPSQVLAKLTRDAESGAISDLRPGDTNTLLWVSSDSAPVPAPTPAPPPVPTCPSFAVSRQPDRDGDCQCANRQFCSLNGGRTRNCPTSGGAGAFGGRYFLASCTDCQCY
jgi:subtilisin family serine protease